MKLNSGFSKSPPTRFPPPSTMLRACCVCAAGVSRRRVPLCVEPCVSQYAVRLHTYCASPQALSHQALRAIASLSPASLSLFLQNYAHKKLDLLCEIFPTQAFT